jgi:prepilin-type N-terminal cleavage/methylation domain-containing protein
MILKYFSKNKTSYNFLLQKAFTLMEMLISIAIISIISGLLLQIYVYSTKINIMIFEQKNLFSQILQINQILQNEIETKEIEFSKYSGLNLN